MLALRMGQKVKSRVWGDGTVVNVLDYGRTGVVEFPGVTAYGKPWQFTYNLHGRRWEIVWRNLDGSADPDGQRCDVVYFDPEDSPDLSLVEE